MLKGFISSDTVYNGFVLAPEGAGGGGSTGTTSGNTTGTTTTSTGEDTSAGDGKNTGQQDGGAPTASGGESQQQPDTSTFTKDQVEKIVEQRLVRDRKDRQKEDDKAKAAERAQQEQELAQKQEWQTLATNRETEIKTLNTRIESLERELEEERTGRIREKVAAKYKLPPEFVARLQGSTEAELDADAKALSKHVAPPKAPDTEGGKGTRPEGGTKPEGTGQKPAATGSQQQQGNERYRFQTEGDIPW